MAIENKYTGKGCISKYEIKVDKVNEPGSTTIQELKADICIQLDHTYECTDKTKKNFWVRKDEKKEKATILIDVNEVIQVDEKLLPYMDTFIGNKCTFEIEETDSGYELISIAYNKG